ncbi:MAG: FtsX-like permease family protein [Vicingaceae bacterium]
MLKNYFKIILKNISKNKFYSFINIFGLAVGISASTLIALFIVDEISFDSHHEKLDRIYRVTTVMDFNGPMDVAVTNMALAPTLRRDYPQVESYARFFGGYQDMEITIDKTVYSESNIWSTDSCVFDVFTYTFLAGDENTALDDPNSIVITETVAEKLYGSIDCIGKTMRLNNTSATVKGVIKDPPQNSEIPVSGLVSLSTMPQGFHDAFNNDWFRIGFYTFLLMKEPIAPGSFDSNLDEVNETYVKPWAESNGIVASHDYSLTPMSEVHFDVGHDYDMPKGSMSNIYMFTALALFLLLIAAFNYINLTLAQQGKRSKEVGIRKTLGASKKSLVFQFLMESLIFTIVAILLGLAFTELFLTKFNILSGKDIHSLDIFNPSIILLELGILVFLGLLAGAYPAFFLSSLRPVTILSGSKSNEGGVGVFRKALILFQFLFSIFMISATFLIGDQMDYMRSMNLGFDRENLISVNLPADTTARKRIQPWIEELENDSRVVSYSRSALPTGGSGELMFRVEKSNKMTESTVKCLFVDEQFIDVLELDILKGRNFSSEFQTDRTSAFIVNQTAVETFGWDDNPINKRVQWGLLENGQAQYDGNVVGVVNDFNFMSLHNPLEPLILCYNPAGGSNLSIRLGAGDYAQTLDDLESSWNGFLPSIPFDYSFFDQDLEENYVEETKTYSVFSYFSGISIVLACLGLFSLLSFSIQSRAKEIGIRKVLGASTFKLSWIIAKDFFIMLGVAFIISTPIVYLLWNNWQQDFAYQSPVNVLSFIAALLLTVFLASIAVAYHSWRIEKSDPVNALREE